ncbi:hypothetical protein [Pedobacter sp. SYSU D00535]|uniref:hypothetical protein n=1 Tax=Pedobacter sp. SYSU D00535 TaxID=2810308 RepID=UPI001A95AB2E|nr:hypothetical protein [Pedobacter sp. SYSU D00535]
METSANMPGGSAEDNRGRKSETQDTGEDRMPPAEEELKELLRKTPDDLNLDDDQDLKADN